MIQLVNGRGQLGEELKKHIKNYKNKKNVFIYHTWNPWDRTQETQKKEYEKFINFVNAHLECRILFISTYSQNDNYYVMYKQLAEAYLINKCEDALAIRLPSLIGNKGVLKKFKESKASPYGEIEFISLTEASEKIIDLASYNGLNKSFTIVGEKISAALANELVNIKT